ncbi:MAG: hypothetical protein KDC44_08405 [Phaeodactylibacter sp.]|nr:hypothetical protein [Phaeodactylibacter sp.]
MTRSNKNLLLWLTTGLFIGSTLASAIKNFPDISFFDAFMIGFGLIVIVLHFAPDRPEIRSSEA